MPDCLESRMQFAGDESAEGLTHRIPDTPRQRGPCASFAPPKNLVSATIASTSNPQYLLNPSSRSFFLASFVPSLTASR